MTVDDVKQLREALTMNGKSKILEIICDNGMSFRTIADTVLWDDAKERLVVIHNEPERHYKNEKPIAITVTEYEHIQFLRTNIKLEELDDMMSSLESAGVTINDKAKIKKYFSDLLSINDLARDPDEKKGYL